MENLPISETDKMNQIAQGGGDEHEDTGTADSRMKPTKEELWQAIQARIQNELGMQRYSIWFKRTELMALEEGALIVGVPNTIILEYLVSRYADPVKGAAADILGHPVDVRFEVAAHLGPEMQTPRPEKRPEPQTPREGLLRFKPLHEQDWESDDLQGPYVVTAQNRMAHAAVSELLKGRRQGFRFLWIRAEHGLGKTALLNYLRRELTGMQPHMRLRQCTAEAWTNEFFYSLQNSKVSKFRDRYRHADVLLLDDVQFLNHKNTPQEELLHTLKALLPKGKIVVLASVGNWREMSGLLPGLRDEFSSSLGLELGVPSADDARAVLQEVAEFKEVPCTPEVIEELAESGAISIRELISTLDTVAAYAHMNQIGRIGLSTARQALGALQHGINRKPTPAKIERVVLKRFRLTHETLAGKSRRRDVTWPRQLVMYLISKHTETSLTDIGRHFGGRNHSTVRHAISKVEGMVESDVMAQQLVAQLEEDILQQGDAS